VATADASHLDWVYGSVLDVFDIFAGHRDAAVRICEALVDSPDQLCAWVLTNSATG
jgi:hypothetical protein